MIVIREPRQMQQQAREWRAREETIGFVPTMGYFHEGHLELMRRARKDCRHLVVSIFVNPTQFGEGEDFEAYPRDMERDSRLAREVGVDVIFYPAAAQMYPPGYQTYVEVMELTQGLCGASRPGHFRGVTTVVAKLFNLVQPHLAYFGEKDYQQLVTIKRMVKDLNMDLQVVGCPTVREEDGLAMSSRNTYLSAEGRKAALCLYRALRRAQDMVEQGESKAQAVLKEVLEVIRREPLARVDYLKICDPDTLEEVEHIRDTARLLMAVWIENTRLIDNGPLKRRGAQT